MLEWTPIIVAIVAGIATVAVGWFTVRAEIRKERASDNVRRMQRIDERDNALWDRIHSDYERVRLKLQEADNRLTQLERELAKEREEREMEQRLVRQEKQEMQAKINRLEARERQLRQRLSRYEKLSDTGPLSNPE
jgi:septal ring factor EnvC (AmiA/AmiB activator)